MEFRVLQDSLPARRPTRSKEVARRYCECFEGIRRDSFRLFMRPHCETWYSLLMHAKASLIDLCLGEHVLSRKHAWDLIVQP